MIFFLGGRFALNDQQALRSTFARRSVLCKAPWSHCPKGAKLAMTGVVAVTERRLSVHDVTGRYVRHANRGGAENSPAGLRVRAHAARAAFQTTRLIRPRCRTSSNIAASRNSGWHTWGGWSFSARMDSTCGVA